MRRLIAFAPALAAQLCDGALARPARAVGGLAAGISSWTLLCRLLLEPDAPDVCDWRG